MNSTAQFCDGARLRHRFGRRFGQNGRRATDRIRTQGRPARPQRRAAEETRKKVGSAEHIVVDDLSSIAETKSVADQVNRLGRFNAVIHNAEIGYREPKLVKTVDSLPQLFAVNTLVPYLLTALITMPKRLVYLSSGMHRGAGSHFDDVLWENRRSVQTARVKRASTLRRLPALPAVCWQSSARRAKAVEVVSGTSVAPVVLFFRTTFGPCCGDNG